MKEISFREFLEVFYFPSDFIVVAENLVNGKFEIFLGGVLNVHSGVWV